MAIGKKNYFKFYDGQIHPIDKERLAKFDTASLLDRYYTNQEISTNDLIDELGSFAIDFTNIFSWSRELPDIDDRSARLFIIWAEDIKTTDVIAIVKGHIMIHNFDLTRNGIKDFHFFKTNLPYYPKVLFTTFRTILSETKELDFFIDQLLKEIENKWQSIRDRVISSSIDLDLRKRFILSFKKIIYYTFVMPSIEQEVIKALKRKDYIISSVMQVLSSKSVFYEEAFISHHLTESKELLSRIDNEKIKHYDQKK